VIDKAKTLPDADQQRLLDIIITGLCNDDCSIGAYASRPEDYDVFHFFWEPLIRDYHKIEGETKQKHDWNIPIDEYVLTKLDPKLTKVSMRARVARNVKGWNLPTSMSKEERLKFEDHMVHVFETFGIPGKYYSETPGHKNHIS
jgi:creatine kinase